MATAAASSDLAWLAGFIDGEGYVGITGMLQRWAQPILSIRHTDPQTLDHISNLLERIGVGERKRYEDRRDDRHKDSWIVSVGGHANLVLLAEVMLPLSITKQRQWEVVRAFCSSRMERPRTSPYDDHELTLLQEASVMNLRGKGVEKGNRRGKE